MRKLPPGKYDIRYQDLSTGELLRSEAFELRQTDESDATRFSDVRLTLYTVAKGYFHVYPLLPSEF